MPITPIKCKLCPVCPVPSPQSPTLLSAAPILNLHQIRQQLLFELYRQGRLPNRKYKIERILILRFFSTRPTSRPTRWEGTSSSNQLPRTCARSPIPERSISINSMNEISLRIIQGYTNSSIPCLLITDRSRLSVFTCIHPYPSWTYACRTTPPFDLYSDTKHLLFKTASSPLVTTASVTTPCMLVLALLFRLYFIVRHFIDLKPRKTYNAMMLTDDQIIEQIPNLQIKKSFKKQFTLFLLKASLMCGAFASIVDSIVNAASDSIAHGQSRS